MKPGGRLVYATCSILHEENDAVADAFQASRPEFRPLSAASLLAAQRIALDTGERLRLWPHLHDTDGFFAADFRARSVNVATAQNLHTAELSEVSTDRGVRVEWRGLQ